MHHHTIDPVALPHIPRCSTFCYGWVPHFAELGGGRLRAPWRLLVRHWWGHFWRATGGRLLSTCPPTCLPHLRATSPAYLPPLPPPCPNTTYQPTRPFYCLPPATTYLRHTLPPHHRPDYRYLSPNNAGVDWRYSTPMPSCQPTSLPTPNTWVCRSAAFLQRTNLTGSASISLLTFAAGTLLPVIGSPPAGRTIGRLVCALVGVVFDRFFHRTSHVV